MGRPVLPKASMPTRDGRPVIVIEPVGNWLGAIRTLGRLEGVIKESSIKAQFKVCREIAKKVKAHIRNQDLGWTELSPIYAERKAAAGLGSKILMAYGTYYRSITVWKPGNRNTVNVGVKKGVYTRRLDGRRGKIEVARIAAMHEFSRGRRLPRRPLWNPTIKELGGAKGIQKMFMGSFLYHLRRNHIPITPFRNLM